MKKLILVLPVILLSACTAPRLYRGEEVAMLIGRSDFTNAAQHAPDFTRSAIRSISKLEYDYFQAKEQVKYCPKCQEQTRQRLQALTQPRLASPPVPPLPK